MQILAVDLENVKSYGQAKVEFSPGVNAIVGHNGAGKSTILEAIGFALFDCLDYKQTEFMRGGAKHATVRATFLSGIDERPYQVVRRVGSGAHYYVYDTELDVRICEGKADVLRFLREHMGVEPGADLTALFKDAVGVPQGTLTAAFLLAEGPRKKVFDSLLQVEEYQQAWERLREPIHLLKSRRGELAVDIAGMEARLERLPDLEEAVARRRQEIRATEKALAGAGLELAEVQQRRGELETVRDALTALDTRLAQARQRLTGTQAQALAAQQGLADAQESSRIVTEHEEGARRYVAAQSEQQALDGQLRRRQQLQAERSTADKLLALSETQLGKLAQELEEARAAVTEAESLRAAVAEQAELEDALNLAQQQEARLKDALQSAAQQQEQVTRLEARLAELQAQHARATTAEGEKAAAERTVDAVRVVIDRYRDEMSQFKTRAELLKEHCRKLEDITTAICPICEQPLADHHRQALVTRNQGEVSALRRRWSDLQGELQEKETQLAAQRDTVQRLQTELLRLPRIEELNGLQQELSRARAVHAAALEQVEALQGAPARIQELGTQLRELGDPRRRHAIAVEQGRRGEQLARQFSHQQETQVQAQRTLAQLDAALAEFAGLDAAVDAVAAELRQNQEAYQAVLSHRRTAESLPVRQQEVADLDSELGIQKEVTARLEREREEVAAQFDAAAYQSLTARGQDLQGQIGGLKTQLSLVQESQTRDEEEIGALQVVQSALTVLQADQQRLAEQEDVLETIRSVLRQAGPHITTALIRQISDGARQIFSEIMQDYSRHLSWNDDYGIMLDVDGHQRQFAQLSGGEQMSAALAVRLALLREMSSIDVAFFDEPTANLDEVRREALARQILAVRGFRQIFVISHDDTFEQATQSLIRVQRVDGVSQVMVE